MSIRDIFFQKHKKNLPTTNLNGTVYTIDAFMNFVDKIRLKRMYILHDIQFAMHYDFNHYLAYYVQPEKESCCLQSYMHECRKYQRKI